MVEIIGFGVVLLIGIVIGRLFPLPRRAPRSMPSTTGPVGNFLAEVSGESIHEWHTDGKHSGQIVMRCDHCGERRLTSGR